MGAKAKSMANKTVIGKRHEFKTKICARTVSRRRMSGRELTPGPPAARLVPANG